MPEWIFKIQVSNYLYNNDIIPLVLVRSQSYSLNQNQTMGPHFDPPIKLKLLA